MPLHVRVFLMIGLALVSLPDDTLAQADRSTQDESKVPSYTLPDPLVMKDGTRVADAETWRTKRRPEILGLFESQMYGKAPGRPDTMRFEVTSVDAEALGGKARRKQVSVHFSDKAGGPRMDLLIYVPKRASGASPAFLGLNFSGNHAIHPDPGITLPETWVREEPGGELVKRRAPGASRGSNRSQWPVEHIIGRGYAVVTAYYGDIDPDFDDGFQNGVHPLFAMPGRSRPGPGEWGSIAAWAWGLSRALDYLATDTDIDAARVSVHGHSRVGKTALWAGALDTRFALVVSNESGEGGAAISRRRFGETTRRINASFPHWFCDNYKAYNDREDELPFDQHMLIALIAPRPVLVCSAEGDLWSDPKGEFLAAKGADPVYRLLGLDGMASRDMPGPNVLIWSTIGYQIRPGKHDVLASDWEAYLDFADRHLRGERSARP